MERKGSREKFQPRMVASFSSPQIDSVAAWLKREVLDSTIYGRTFYGALQTVKLDEKGRVMDEKSRKRLTYGRDTINMLHEEGVKINQIAGTIQVWQTTPDEHKIELRYARQPRNFGQRRY